jgi:VWFA-related protein
VRALRLALVVSAVLSAVLSAAQNGTIRTEVPLVLVPASVTDTHGNPLYGLAEPDFEVLDDGQPRPFHIEPSDVVTAPLPLVIAVDTSSVTSAALAKIRKVGGIVTEAVAGANASVAVLTFDGQVQVIQPFTQQPDNIARAFYSLKLSGSGRSPMVDAVNTAIDLLNARSGPQRPAILLIGQARDHGSKSKLPDVIVKAQRSAITVHALTYSTFLTPFTAKPDDYTPPEDGPNYFEALANLVRLAKTTTVTALTSATGGLPLSFERQAGLETALLNAGKDMHTRYMISFRPYEDPESRFHKIEIRVRDQPKAIIRARPGYWSSAKNF